jgi:predicted NUDIX family phosphoesterase
MSKKTVVPTNVNQPQPDTNTERPVSTSGAAPNMKVPTTVSSIPAVVPTQRLALCIQTRGLNAMTSQFTEGRHVLPVPNDFYALPVALVDRNICESDANTLQLLPYLVLQRTNGDIFMYARGQGGAEARLVGNLSIGVGGHMDEAPGVNDSLYSLIQGEARREILEEVGLDLAGVELEFRWLLRDLTNSVGLVHLGVVALVQVDDAAVESQEPGVIESGTWMPLAALREAGTYERLESWSQAMVDTLI